MSLSFFVGKDEMKAEAFCARGFLSIQLDFFQHPKGIFSTPKISLASRRGLKDLIEMVVLVVVERIVVEVVVFGGCGCLLLLVVVVTFGIGA